MIVEFLTTCKYGKGRVFLLGKAYDLNECDDDTLKELIQMDAEKGSLCRQAPPTTPTETFPKPISFNRTARKLSIKKRGE